MQWRWIEPEAPVRTGVSNMALDHALLEAVKAGGRPVLRFYRWEPGCLSFGRNQPAAGLYDATEAARRGIDIVRRPTGGQAVFHHRELTYAVVVPVGVLGSPRETYQALNRGLVAGLRRVGVEAEVFDGRVASVASAAGAADWLAPCFRIPAGGEVVAGGRKLVGSAQRCESRVLLQHGSILLAGDQSPTTALLRDGDGYPPEMPATLEALLARVPAPAALAAALAAGMEEVLGIALAPGRLSHEDESRAAGLEPCYRSAEWTWRR